MDPFQKSHYFVLEEEKEKGREREKEGEEKREGG